MSIEILEVVSLVAGALAAATSLSTFFKGRKARNQMKEELIMRRFELIKALEAASAVDGKEHPEDIREIYAKYLQEAFMHLNEDNRSSFSSVVSHLSDQEKADYVKELLSENHGVASDAK